MNIKKYLFLLVFLNVFSTLNADIAIIPCYLSNKEEYSCQSVGLRRPELNGMLVEEDSDSESEEEARGLTLRQLCDGADGGNYRHQFNGLYLGIGSTNGLFRICLPTQA